MVKTTYQCDKCKAEQATSEQFWTVGVFARSDYGRYAGPEERLQCVENKQLHVCRPCLELLGIHVTRKAGAPVPAAPSIEELIGQIIERCQP